MSDIFLLEDMDSLADWVQSSIDMTELEHHGIPGMKWGIRRTPEQLGHDTAKRSDATKAAMAIRSKEAAARSGTAAGTAAGTATVMAGPIVGVLSGLGAGFGSYTALMNTREMKTLRAISKGDPVQLDDQALRSAKQYIKSYSAYRNLRDQASAKLMSKLDLSDPKVRKLVEKGINSGDLTNATFAAALIKASKKVSEDDSKIIKKELDSLASEFNTFATDANEFGQLVSKRKAVVQHTASQNEQLYIDYAIAQLIALADHDEDLDYCLSHSADENFVENYEEYLGKTCEQYGIPGMKWGIRRTPAQLGHDIAKKLKRGKPLTKEEREYLLERGSKAQKADENKLARASEVKARQAEYSNKELQDYLSRHRSISEISKMSKAEQPIQKVMKRAKEVDAFLRTPAGQALTRTIIPKIVAKMPEGSRPAMVASMLAEFYKSGGQDSGKGGKGGKGGKTVDLVAIEKFINENPTQAADVLDLLRRSSS